MNAAFVLEFFTQTLVKRGYLSQRKHLAANLWLMCAGDRRRPSIGGLARRLRATETLAGASARSTSRATGERWRTSRWWRR